MHVFQCVKLVGDIDTNVDTIVGKLPTNYIMGSSVQTDKDDEIDDIKTQTDKLPNVVRPPVSYWSDPQEELTLTGTAGDKSLPDVVVDDLPTGATVVKAVAMFFARYIEDTSGSENKLNGATVASTSQVIQVRDDTPGSWGDAINFANGEFTIAASTREGGPLLIGSVDVSSIVDGNDTYNFQWLQAKATGANLNFNDIQVGLRVWYKL